MTPDPKDGKRTVDPQASIRLLLMYDACAACGLQATNAHHIIQKGSPHFGDDVIENMVPICGTGTMRCHGAIHGTPYYVVTREGEKRTGAWVARRIGENLVRERREVIAYVRAKLGPVSGDEYLSRFYGIEPEHYRRTIPVGYYENYESTR